MVMDIEAEIARALDEAFDAWDGKKSEPQFVASRLMPVVKRAQAEATTQTLLALSEKYEDFGKREASPVVKITYKTVAALMAAEAEHIEQGKAGA